MTASKDMVMAEETKKRLKESFMALYETDPLNRINIQRITDAAGLSRGTFYYYYRDIFDLLTEIEDELIRGLNATVRDQDMLEDMTGEVFEDWLEVAARWYMHTLDYLAQNRKAFLALYNGPERGSFRDKLKGITRENLRAAFKSDLGSPEGVGKYLVEYISAGSIAAYMSWLETGMEESAYELAAVNMSIMFRVRNT